MSLIDALLLDPHPFEVWIAYRTDGVKGSGTLNDPFDGSTDTKFDSIMSNLLANTPLRVHLGPATAANPFKTRGFWLQSNGTPTSTPAWQPKANMAIVGAGVGVTNLQLQPGTDANSHYFAIGGSTTTPVDFFELSDVTIDCNLPSTGTAACGALRVMGNHIRVRRVKCVNWGSRTTAQPGFVIALIIADPDSGSPVVAVDDAGLEDCIVVSPSANNTVANAVVNILHIGGREVTSSVLTQFGRAPFIRNCFVDSDSPTTPVAEYRGLSMGACHGGVVEGNQIHNTKYGGPYQEVVNTREIIVRNNTYRNVIKGPYWRLGATNSIGADKLLVERNHIQLIASSPTPTPIGIQVDDRNVVSQPPPYIYGQVVIRHNRVRYVDSTPGSFNGYGIDVAGANALMISDNVVEVTPSNPIRNTRCASTTYFNNKTASGNLLLGWESALNFRYGELATDAEDAFVLALLEKR